MRALRYLVRRLLAGLVLAAVVTGPPVALWLVGPAFLPDRLPTGADLFGALLRPDDGRVLLGLLVVVGVGAWLILAGSILIELAAVALRRPAPRIGLPGFGWGRSVAAALIATTIGAGASPAIAAPLAAVAIVRTEPVALPDASARHAEVQPAADTYTVKPRDTLWRIAEHELGDPLRWREIYELNAGRPQADGARLTEASMLRTGWRLQLPTRSTADVVTVGQGESLTRIAADRLGDPARATEIFNENRGRVQADGGRLTDPDLLQPGWRLDLPVPSAAPAPPPRPPQEPTSPAPTSSASPVAPRTDAAPEPGTSVDEPSSALPTALWFSPLVVAGIVGALGVRRRLQRRRRRPHHRIAVPPDEAGRLEWLATSAPAAVDSALLDAALRGLVLTDWSGVAPPDLTTVRLDPGRAVLTLADRAPMPPPFTEVDDGHVWQLEASADLPLGRDEAGGHCAPYPTLVSVARDDDRVLLIDLEQWGSTVVLGPAVRTTELLRHMAAELANSRGAQDVEVVMAGFGSELVPLNPERLRQAKDLGSALDTLRAAVAGATANVDRLPVDGVLDGRLRDVAADAWLPVLLLAAGPFSDNEQEQLRQVREQLAHAPRVAAAVVVTGTDVDAGDPWIHIDDLGRLTTQHLDDGPWKAEQMTADTGAGIAEILGSTDAPDIPARAAAEDAPWAPDMAEDGSLLPSAPPVVPLPRVAEEPPPVVTDPDALRRLEIVNHQDPDLDGDLNLWRSDSDPVVPMIGILGEPTVRTPGQLPSARPSWFTEVLIYLALHAGGITIPKATADLWPDGRSPSAATVRHAFYGARRWAGRGLHGDPAAPFVSDMQTDDRYRLHGHLLDWDLFRRLRKRAQARHAAGHPGAVQDYETALELLRGPVLSQLRPDGYAWLNNHDQRHDLQIPGFVVDTAHELVDIALAAGDTALARRAAEAARAVDIDAGFDQPLVDLMRVAHAEGNPAEMEQYATILLDAREFDVPEELPPDTFAVVNELLPAGPRRRSS
ncbi:LysM peptidoglycan-binding domain-containing protein [Pseudonocardia sp. 73-21]|uniref:LysM peptidoglycan-binding domain-containing protein n=1 Tax=Pseudonocardia sp. 73-21 TaxID=1895809 RepID=UPI002623B503|nr:LysM peptidoglycan-binding domain-containing protein [Pseudonocardia sp. 73-21]